MSIAEECQVEKYELGHFGACPRVFCHATNVLPCGRSDVPGVDTVKLFCPNCGDIYGPPSSKYQAVDGAFFGTTFAPLFFQTYPELLAAPFYASPSGSETPVGGQVFTNPNPHGGQKAALGKVYVPRIYGFKVSERAKSGPRMRWLRERPERAEELDRVDASGRWEEPAAVQGAKGSLFDDDDDDDDDEEEEEEEEVGTAPAAAAVAA